MHFQDGTRWQMGCNPMTRWLFINQSFLALMIAVQQVGGMEFLVRLEQEDPTMFVPLLIKAMPPEPKVPQEGGLNIHIGFT